MPSVPDLSRLIPLSARVVLDVGCGLGAIGAAYRRLNPNARLLAIDSDPAMVAAAGAHYDVCVVADAGADLPSFDLPNGIDCIVYSGRLEQVPDPFATLRRHADALAQSGTMLIAIDNVEHWTRARRMLMGGHRHEADSQFDRRSIRWFGLDTMSAGLAEAGLVGVDAQPEMPDDPAGKAFIEAIAAGLRNLGIDPAAYARAALPRRYVWRVRRQAVRRMIVAGDMLRPIGGVSHLRVLHPLAAMATDPEVVTQLAPADNPPEFAGALDQDAEPGGIPRVFILHRPGLYGAEGQATVDRLIARGWVVVTEFDDHPDHMPGMVAPGLISFHGVHAVQTTTPVLAEALSRRNPELALFPNAIAELPIVRNFSDPGVLTVFFGALNREQDWRPIMAPINAIAARLGSRLRFRVVHDEGFFQALETRHKTFTPLCDYDTYLDLLGTSEISLMPLDDTPFNRAKSDLKFIEAGACRVATLASTVVYRHSVVEGETGLLFDGPEAFHRQFLRLTAIPDLALEIGNNARRMVIRDRMLADQVAPRIAWYRDLWRRRAELTEALRARTNQYALTTA